MYEPNDPTTTDGEPIRTDSDGAARVRLDFGGHTHDLEPDQARQLALNLLAETGWIDGGNGFDMVARWIEPALRAAHAHWLSTWDDAPARPPRTLTLDDPPP